MTIEDSSASLYLSYSGIGDVFWLWSNFVLPLMTTYAVNDLNYSGIGDVVWLWSNFVLPLMTTYAVNENNTRREIAGILESNVNFEGDSKLFIVSSGLNTIMELLKQVRSRIPF